MSKSPSYVPSYVRLQPSGLHNLRCRLCLDFQEIYNRKDGDHVDLPWALFLSNVRHWSSCGWSPESGHSYSSHLCEHEEMSASKFLSADRQEIFVLLTTSLFSVCAADGPSRVQRSRTWPLPFSGKADSSSTLQSICEGNSVKSENGYVRNASRKSGCSKERPTLAPEDIEAESDQWVAHRCASMVSTKRMRWSDSHIITEVDPDRNGAISVDEESVCSAVLETEASRIMSQCKQRRKEREELAEKVGRRIERDLLRGRCCHCEETSSFPKGFCTTADCGHRCCPLCSALDQEGA